MPRQTIPTADGKLSVGWTPDRDVQVGVEVQPIVLINGVEQPGVTTTNGSGQWVTLNRAELNRLIRALRKARDAAFGADA